eukprot:19260-Eustigmatos_ZCMA.PRE.1
MTARIVVAQSNAVKPTRAASYSRCERGDEVIDDPVYSQTGWHVEREVADHEWEELEDRL